MTKPRLDEVGYWTEVKLAILREYSQAYTRILSKQPELRHIYVDGCAGSGTHISKATGELIKGSPRIALKLEPKFSHYHFIDLDGQRTQELKRLARGRQDVSVYTGDCNLVLVEEVFPKCRYEDYRRALCLLDPYGLNLRWDVVEAAGKMKSIEIFLTFMIMDANMNVLWRDPGKVPSSQIVRMNAFWGDDTWKQAVYAAEQDMFGPVERKGPNEALMEAYRRRLQERAGFKFAPPPMAMRNRKGAVIYYLFFASHNETGDRIARSVFRKYRDKGMVHGR